ncbi:hypothetical protein LXL04_022336 [Taraxacum kok-saghyz]
MSSNICGVRNRVKRRRLSNFCSVHGNSFLGVQETRGNKKAVIEVVVCTVFWVLWRFRNDMVHGAGKLNRNILFDVIREYSFLWFCNRQVKNRRNEVSD